jgi:predicted transcriptional regulator
MLGIKTAISLEKNLFNQVNQLANDMHVSRSELFTLAVKDYLKKQESKKILAQLNAAYGDSSNKEEDLISKAMLRKQFNVAANPSSQQTRNQIVQNKQTDEHGADDNQVVFQPVGKPLLHRMIL